MDEGEEDYVELVVAGNDASEALESAEESFDQIEASIEFAAVGPGLSAVSERRYDGLVAQFARQGSSGVAFTRRGL